MTAISNRQGRRLIFSLLATFAAAFLPLLPRADSKLSSPSQPNNLQQGYQLKATVNVVNVAVTVTDARGNFISGLEQKNFRVLDDGVEQPVTYFSPIDAPAQVLVLVETSPAVYLIHRDHLQAAYALLADLAPDDRVALATYDSTAGLVLGFTTDKRMLAQAMGGLQYNLGMAQLNFYDSLAMALDWLAPLADKKAIVLLTTGLDDSGAGHWEALLAKLRQSDVMILPVALGAELREPAESPANKKRAAKKTNPREESSTGETGSGFAAADRALRAMAEATGGHAHFPRDARDFPKIYRQIAALLRHQYSLGFALPAPDNRYHTLTVQLLDENGRVLDAALPGARFRVNHRQSYLAPAR